VWIDNEHAEDRNVATPKIEARLLEPAHDGAIIEALSKDARGPLALFTDPCWLDRNASAAALPRDARCTSDGAATAAAIPSRSAKRATSHRKK
jgi:hypothetical protein